MHQTSQPDPAPENTWKKAVIIGGMVGASLLMGALVLRAQLPGLSGSTATPQVEPSIASSPATTKPTSQPAAQDPVQQTPEAPAVQAPEAPAAQAPVQSAPARPIDTSNTNAEVVGAGGSKNVRAGAGTNYNIVETVQPGDRVRILESAKNSQGETWLKLYIPRTDSQGWVLGKFVRHDESEHAAPVDQTNAIIIGSAGSKNIRSGPGTNFEVKHVAYPGDRVEILDSDQDQGGFTWYEVSFPQSGAKGWIAAQLVKRD